MIVVDAFPVSKFASFSISKSASAFTSVDSSTLLLPKFGSKIADNAVALLSIVVPSGTDASTNTSTTTFTGQWNQRIGDRLRLALILQYQHSDDNLDFDSDAFEQQFDIVWRRGQTELYAQLRNSITDTNADDTTLQRFIVGLRREF